MPKKGILGGEGDAEIDMEGVINGGDRISYGDVVAEGREDDTLRLVPMLEDEEDERVVDLLIFDESRGSILKPCVGCGHGVIGAHRCPECSAHMHVFYGDELDEGGLE